MQRKLINIMIPQASSYFVICRVPAEVFVGGEGGGQMKHVHNGPQTILTITAKVLIDLVVPPPSKSSHLRCVLRQAVQIHCYLSQDILLETAVPKQCGTVRWILHNDLLRKCTFQTDLGTLVSAYICTPSGRHSPAPCKTDTSTSIVGQYRPAARNIFHT